METIKKNASFIKGIIDGMFDWVRVLDKDDNIIYMNKAMREGMKTAVIGSKCYTAVGRTEPCENCISRKAVFDGDSHEKEEMIGDRVFSVMSSPVKNEKGEIVAVVEVLRDTTKVKLLQHEILKQNTKLRDDLSMAKRLQCSMLPKQLPEDCLDFSFIYNPCEALGGDFLDIFRIDASHIGLYIADVSGHGVPASLLTVFLRSTLDKRTLSPAEALKNLYKEFNSSNFGGDLYITLFYCIIDIKNKTMSYSNAGHNVCPILMNTKDKTRFKPVRLPGIPISHWVENPDYKDDCIRLQVNDRLFLYTDGIIEIKNSNNEQFGEDRLLNLLYSNKDTVGTLNSIFNTACEFAGLTDLTKAIDDITIALLEIKC
jgi:Serine phosphatase RsbU, regulator of sigma subunit